jgi:uncharacterized protein (TIGR01777 family)
MRIGITGASGFIGRAVVKRAIEHGHEVVAFSRSTSTRIDGVHEVRDFSDPAAAKVAGLDAVVHLAGEPIVGLWTKAKRQRILDSRVDGTKGLVNAIGQCADGERPEVLVCASGSGFYGDRGDEVLTEDDDPGMGFLANVCLQWEAAARAVQGHGTRCVMARTGMVLGADGGAAPLLKKVFRFCLGGRLGTGKQWVPWVDIEDTAQMFVVACENAALTGAVNFVAPHPVTNAEFTRVIAAQVHRPAIAPAPAALLRLALRGMTEMLLNSQRLDPEALKLEEFEWIAPQIDLAIRRSFE